MIRPAVRTTQLRDGAAVCEAVKRSWIITLAAVAVLAMNGTATAASGWREMVHRTDRFLTDGHRYAAWADFASPSLSLLDTWSGKRRVVGKPVGCSLPTTFYDPSGLGALAYPRLLLWCRRQEPYGRVLDLRTGAVTPVAADGAVLPRRPTADGLCRSVSLAYRRAVRRGRYEGVFFSVSPTAMLGFQGGGLRLTRCGQRSVVVDHRGSAQTPRVGAGWATWDTGLNLSFYDGFPVHAPGTVEAVRLRDLARRTWTAPRLRVVSCGGARTPRLPFGRADHTRTRVFWIATTAGEDQDTCDPSRARVFWTPLH